MDGSPWGGSEELWANTAARALQAGFRVSVCIPLRRRPHHEKLNSLERSGADLFCLPETRGYFRLRELSSLVRALHNGTGRFFREYLSPLPGFFATKPDVVLISDGASLPAAEIIEAVSRRYASKPYIILSQANVGGVTTDVHREQVLTLYQNARWALFVSENNLRATERQLARKLLNGRVVRNPVNLNSSDPIPWPEEQTYKLASVARLAVATKGQDILFEALSDQKWQERDWRLSLYGSGDDAAYLQDLATFYGLNDRISFNGQITDVRSIWRDHHALVLPSRAEGTPLAMVEAMLCARPVIATAVAGIPEWVRHGRNGFLAHAPVAECFAATLETAWRQRTRWQVMGINARRDALALYDPAPADTLLSIITNATTREVR